MNAPGAGPGRGWGWWFVGLVALAACDDTPDVPVADINVLTSSASFPDADPRVAAGNRMEVVVRNDGDGLLTVSAVRVVGDSAFSLVGGGGPFTLFPNDFRPIVVEFLPTDLRPFSAALDILSDDPDEPSVTVGVSGTGARVVYTQVDRAGVPGMNLMFNHADGLVDFDLARYNLLSPVDDTLHMAKVETVLDWFGNADPQGTRAMLLPEALTVNMSSSPSSLAAGTGRELADDALDVMLMRVLGAGEPTVDGVGENDLPFALDFPYLPAPHLDPDP